MTNDTPSSLTDSTPFPVPPKPSRWQRFLAFPVTRIVLYFVVFAALAFLTSEAFSGLLHVLHHRPHTFPILMMTLGEGIVAASALLAF